MDKVQPYVLLRRALKVNEACTHKHTAEVMGGACQYLAFM